MNQLQKSGSEGPSVRATNKIISEKNWPREDSPFGMAPRLRVEGLLVPDVGEGLGDPLGDEDGEEAIDKVLVM